MTTPTEDHWWAQLPDADLDHWAQLSGADLVAELRRWGGYSKNGAARQLSLGLLRAAEVIEAHDNGRAS